MIVRELITRLGFVVDQASFDKAEANLADLRAQMLGQKTAAQQANAAMAQYGDQTKAAGDKAKEAGTNTGLLGEALGMVQRFAAAAGLSNLLREYITLASDANETKNVLGEVFGAEGQKRVEDWSATMGAAMGRSAYDLQAYASRLGSVIGPVAKSQQAAEDMSKSLAGLAVDLGSFFNTSDQDAMQALRSGLTGEYESLKRYGVVLNDATLAEVANQKGIKKKITAMTTAEKTELRYLAIMERTKAAQGDAARTGDGFANASKALAAQLKDLGTNMAMTVIPAVEKLVRFARDAVTWFNNMAKGSEVMRAAMITLGAAAVVLGAEFYAAFILPTLAIAALILLLDEMLTLFSGGETVFGRLVNAMAGDHAAENWVLNTTAGFEILDETIDGVWKKFMKTWGDAGGWAFVMAFWEDFGIQVGDWAAALADAFTWPIRKLRAAMESIGMKLPAPQAMLNEQSYARATGRGVNAGVQDGFNAFHAQRDAEFRAGKTASDASTADLSGRRYATGRGSGAGVSNEAGVAAVSGTVSAAPGAVTAPAPAAGGAAAAAAPVIVPVNSAAPTININGGDPAQVKRAIMQALVADRKAQIAAVGRQGGS